MNAFLNYLVEANLGLGLMLLMYVLFLRGETDFSVKRGFLLMSVAASVIFPLIRIDGGRNAYLPSLMNVLPTTWLPEFVVTAEGGVPQHAEVINVWAIGSAVYATGLVMALALLGLRLFVIARTLLPLNAYRLDNHLIFESDDNRSSFSFFRFIYIGQARVLSVEEKTMIIHHEQIHARQLHSFDILLINIVGVFFWFNPVVGMYRKIFIQLHEFEADARSVSPRDVDNYCSLLAKVALLSADIQLANHFSNSLTVKRIEMMRTLKAKIKRWKYVACAAVIPSFFVVVACQDQVADDLADVARNSSNAVLVPDYVQARYDEKKKANPHANILLLDLNQVAVSKLEKLGPSGAIEIFAPGAEPKKENYATTVLTAEQLQVNARNGSTVQHTYAILEYDDRMDGIVEDAKSADQIYTVVDHPAEYPGGMPALMEFLAANLVYPEEARNMGLEGNVFVSFVVEKDGAVTTVEPVKGVSPELDTAAIKVIQLMPKWSPGKQNGNVVRSRFVMPIKFKLNN